MLKKFLIILAAFTAGEVTMCIRQNMIANSIAKTNGSRPIVLKPKRVRDFVLLKLVDRENENTSEPIPIRFL